MDDVKDDSVVPFRQEQDAKTGGKEDVLRIVIMGGPASGKGTQSETIAERYGVIHLSTGDMLREAVRQSEETENDKTSLGFQAKQFMNEGQLVPDKLIIDIVRERLQQSDCQARGWILDGFPRTAAQATAMIQAGLHPDVVLYIQVPDEVLIERISGRRVDVETGKVYHVEYNPPPPGIPPERLVTRADDSEDKIKKRLADFHSQTQAAKEAFSDVVVLVDGNAPPAQVAETIRRVLDKQQDGVVSAKTVAAEATP